jgi:hypothetical protein
MGIRIAGCLPALVSLQHAELNWPDTQRIGGKKMKFSYHLSNFKITPSSSSQFHLRPSILGQLPIFVSKNTLIN